MKTLNKIISRYYIIIIWILISTSAFAFDEVKNININDNMLPSNGTISTLLLTYPNDTITFQQMDFDSHVNLTFVNSTFTNNDTIYQLDINYTVTNFTLPQTLTLLSSIFINDSVGNSTKTYGIYFNINKTEPNIIVDNSFNISLTNGAYIINVSPIFLPLTGSVSFQVQGFTGNVVNITDCSGFLSCPTNITLDSSGQYIAQINYNIGSNTSIGQYLDNITWSSGNVTQTSQITFNVIIPEVSVEVFTWKDSCFAGNTSDEIKNNLASCLNDYEQFSARRFTEAIQKYLQSVNSTCQPTIQEKLVLTGSISDQENQLYSDCTSQLSQCTSNLATANGYGTQAQDCLSKFDNLNTENLNVKKDCEQKVSDSYSKMKLYGILFVVGIVIILALIYLVIYIGRINRWWI